MTAKSFAFVDAIYRPMTGNAGQANPFVQALPALPNDVDLMMALTHMPPFDPTERLLSKEYRIQRLEVLADILIALPRIVRLARGMLKMMISGYASRRPHSAEDGESLNRLYAMQQNSKFASAAQSTASAQRTMSLVGASGCGKSFSVEHITKLLPPAIYHESLGKWQLPFLVVEMSYDGESVHTLATRIYEAIDKLLPDGNYQALLSARNGRSGRSESNSDQRLANALLICRALGVGEIVVDESQNKREVGNGSETLRRHANVVKETPLTKLMITASNTSKIPLLFTGTLEMKSVFGSRFTISRRMSGRGSAEWHPYEAPTGDVENPTEFELLVMAFFRYQWVRNPVPYSFAWAQLFFELCQGIPDIFVKLFESSQEMAISSNKETLTEDLVRSVFAKEFVSTAFGIKALRSKDRVMLAAITDLYSAPQRAVESPPRVNGPAGSQPASATPPIKAAKAPRAKKICEEPTPAEIDVASAAGADVRIGEDGALPVAARPLKLSELVGGDA